MRKNKQHKFLYPVIMSVMLSLFVFACGGGGGSDGGGASEPVLTGTVAISGTAKEGSQLTAVISADANGIPIYQWEWINGETTSNVGTNNIAYNIKVDDIGGIIRVSVSYTGYSGSITCTTDIVAPANSGAGTSVSPFLVYSVETLEKVGTETETGKWKLSAHYKQIVDIDLTGISWIPIGDDSNNSDDSRFTGTYDGNNKKILNLTINSGGSLIGLFGIIGTNGLVKNLGLEGVDVTGNASEVGGVVGYNGGGTVSNCYVTGNVAGRYHVGGVVGRVFVGIVQNCYTTGSVKSQGSAGGVVGFNQTGIIQNCYSTCDIVGTNDVGGIIGYTGFGTVLNCYATGKVEGSSFVGGVVGRVYTNVDRVKNSVALNSTVTGSTDVGRVLGGFDGPPSETLSNNYARGDMGGSTALFTVKTLIGKDGVDIDTTDYLLATWWTTGVGTTWVTAAWDEGIWDIADGRLPLLR